MELLLAFLTVIFAFIVQTTIVTRLSLLNGMADILMLIIVAWGLQEQTKNAWMWAILAGLAVGFATAAPWFIFPISYLLITLITNRIRTRIWQSPILAMMIITCLGTILILGVQFIFLRMAGINLEFKEILTRTILPSMLLNLLFAFPVYWGMRELSRIIHKSAKN